MSEERFGKFEVVGFLGRGGMAEVFLCRLGGLGGFNKEVVVKRILPERVSDPAFLRMFLDEARVAANLNHPNIVQIYEIAEAEGLPYIAMEYVRGPTFATVIRETMRGKQLHLGHVAKILSGVCEGLHHAHSALGPNREILDLVHRDVSPQNIIISPEGAPKLLDFGVAKARGGLATTEAGTLKGKLRYMAPEQLQQEPVDHRADVFSVGVLLCEATTGRNPFGAKQLSEVQLFKSIVSGIYRKPSELAPDFPEELERIILWAMEPNVNLRCPSAEALHEALEKFVSSGPYASSTRAVATWMNEQVARKFFSVPLPTDEHRPFRAVPVASRVASPSVGSLKGDPAWSGAGPLDGEVTAVEPGAVPFAVPSRGSRLLFIAGLGALAAAVLLVAVPRGRSVEPQAPLTEKRSPEKPRFSPDEAARAYLDEAERYGRSGRLAPAVDVLAKARELKISDPSLNIRLLRLREEFEIAVALRKAESLLQAGESKQAAEMAKELLERDPSHARAVEILAAVRRSRAARAAALETRPLASRTKKRSREGVLNVTSSPPGMVYLDDDLIGRAPLKGRNLAPGTYTLQVRARGHRPYETSIKILPGRELALVVPLTAESSNGTGSGEKAKELLRWPSMPPFPPRPSPFETPAPPSSTQVTTRQNAGIRKLGVFPKDSRGVQ